MKGTKNIRKETTKDVNNIDMLLPNQDYGLFCKEIREYNQEMAQSQTTDQPRAPHGSNNIMDMKVGTKLYKRNQLSLSSFARSSQTRKDTKNISLYKGPKQNPYAQWEQQQTMNQISESSS